MRIKTVKNVLITVFPRYSLEGIAIATFHFLGLFLNRKTTSISLLGEIAFVAQRLLPSLQSIYSSWAKLKIYTQIFALFVKENIESI